MVVFRGVLGISISSISSNMVATSWFVLDPDSELVYDCSVRLSEDEETDGKDEPGE